MKRIDCFFFSDDGRNADPAILKKFNKIKPAIRGNILILLADGLAAAINFNMATFFGKLLRARIFALIGMQAVEQGTGKRA